MTILFHCDRCKVGYHTADECGKCERKCEKEHKVWLANRKRKCPECGVVDPVFSRHESSCSSNLF